MTEPAGAESAAMDDRLRDRRELERLLAELSAARESERRALAGEIHDGVIQSMAATSLRLEQLRIHLDRPDQEELLAKVDESLRDSITRLRRLMNALARPASARDKPKGILEQAGREP
jgi:signal transduction histidine kinase